MLRITNLTDKEIDISKNVILKARQYIDVRLSVDSRLYQLMNMGVIKIQEISEKPNISNESCISSGSLRRKQMMERIRNGDVKPGVSLNVSLYKQAENNNTNQKSKKNKKNK